MAKRPAKTASKPAVVAQTPAGQRQLTEVEVAALVTSWDDARAELSAAGDEASRLQAEFDALDPAAPAIELAEKVEAARNRVTAAHATIAALAPLPEGVRLPDAKKTEIPAGSQDGGQGQQGNDASAPAQTGQGPGDGTAKVAPVETGAVASAPGLPNLDAMFRAEVERLAAETGQVPADIYAFAHQLLAGRVDVGGDIEDFGAYMAAGHQLLDDHVAVDLARGEDAFTLTVIGPVGGRRRAGFDFGGMPQTVSVTAEQRAQILSDASLSVSTGRLASMADVNAVRHRLADTDFTFDGPLGCVTVLGPAKGRRRAGFDFGATARTIEVNRDQLASILADEALAVTPA